MGTYDISLTMEQESQELVKAAVSGILMAENEQVDACSSLRVLVRIINNIINEPTNDKFHKLPLHNKTINRRVTETSGAFEILSILGFYVESGSGSYIIDYSPDPNWLQTLKNACSILQSELH